MKQFLYESNKINKNAIYLLSGMRFENILKIKEKFGNDNVIYSDEYEG